LETETMSEVQVYFTSFGTVDKKGLFYFITLTYGNNNGTIREELSKFFERRVNIRTYSLCPWDES